MKIEYIPANEEEIKNFRQLFLAEFNNQFVHDKCHYYGWSTNYLLKMDNMPVGYCSSWGMNERNIHDTIFEMYVLPSYRNYVDKLAESILQIPGVHYIQCQSNDPFLAEIFFQYAGNIQAESILFQEYYQTHISEPGAVFRKRKDTDKKERDDDGPYVLEIAGEIVAHGGLLMNYNFPYADIYMHVFERHRRKGYGALIVQELKKLAYESGRVPAARCNKDNIASKHTLMNAGLKPCGFIFTGEIKRKTA